MASSSSSPSPLTNPNPKSLATFTASPLHKPHPQALLGERAKRRRQRALRMSREKQIPALALHCASQLPTKPCFNENPHCFLKGDGVYLNEVGKFGQFCQNLRSQEALAPPCNASPGGGLVLYDGRVLQNRAMEGMDSISDCSSGDGDVSEVGSDRGPDLFELRNWQDGSSSSPSSSYGGPLNVTRAVSECSSDERAQAEFGILNNDDSNDKEGHGMKGDLSAEYWKLQADVLAAECNLLRVEKELALKRWNQGCSRNDDSSSMVQVLKVNSKLEGRKKDGALEHASGLSRHTKHSYYEDQTKEASQDKLHDMSHSMSSFTGKTFRKLDETANRCSWGRVPNEDPTEALQERLQNFLLTAQSPLLEGVPCKPYLNEKQSQMHSFSDLRFYDAWDKVDTLGVRARTIDKRTTRESMLSNQCYAETYRSRKQQGFMSLELSETKAAAAFIRREYRSMLSDEDGLLSSTPADQMPGEEMYCKEVIRQMVAQVQAESEQWSQVQEILLSLQEEMGVLIEARELWEDRALKAEAELLSSEEMAHDWRCRAQSAEEEAAVLRSERHALKIKIHNMKQKHAAERKVWNEARSRPNEGVPLPIPDSQPSIGAACEVEDQPRHASVGTREDYALCESIVHSRNESSRSSLDLGTTSQRAFHKNIKKSLDFSNSSNDGNTSKSRVRSHRFTDQILKIEPTRLDFCSKTNDVDNRARHKLSSPLLKVELTRLECIEPVSVNEHKERKKARLFTSKENYSKSGPIDAQISCFAESYLQKGSLGQVLSAAQDSVEQVTSSKPKSSVPSAPTSTPSRLPFAEIFNSPASR